MANDWNKEKAKCERSLHLLSKHDAAAKVLLDLPIPQDAEPRDAHLQKLSIEHGFLEHYINDLEAKLQVCDEILDDQGANIEQAQDQFRESAWDACDEAREKVLGLQFRIDRAKTKRTRDSS